MTLIIKAGTGLVAGAVAGVLGLAFLPHVEPIATKPRQAVEKPQFVEAAPAPKSTEQVAPRAAPVTVAAQPTNPPKPQASAPTVAQQGVAPQSAAAPTPAPAVAVAVAAIEPPKPSPSVVTRSVQFASDAEQAVKSAVATPKPVAAPSPRALGYADTAAAPALKAAPPEKFAANPAAADMSVQGLVALARGDLSSARLYLARAAEAGEPRAWVALADSYDPTMLAKLGVVGAPGDAQRAKDFLAKAAAAGVVVAKDRLVALDQNQR